METNFNHEQSLALITEMINQARNNVQKGRMTSVIYWGYVIAAIAIANFVLLHALQVVDCAYAVWLATIPAAVVSLFIDRKVRRSALVKTHIDRIGDMLWKGFGISVFLFIFAIYVAGYRLNSAAIFIMITPVIMVMVGLCQFATACIFRYRPWFWIAALFWLGGVACSAIPQDVQFLVLASCMILGYSVPGHLLNRRQKRSHV